MSNQDLAAFIAETIDDVEVRAQLIGLRQPQFGEAVVTLAGQRGFAVEPADVEAAQGAARRTWWERWV